MYSEDFRAEKGCVEHVEWDSVMHRVVCRLGQVPAITDNILGVFDSIAGPLRATGVVV